MMTSEGTAQTGSENLADPLRVSFLRALQTQAYNAGIYESFAQLFQGYEGSLAVIFRRMATEELRYGTKLERCYCNQFGALPNKEPKAVIELPGLAASQHSILDHVRTLEQALTTALHVAERAQNFYARVAFQTPNSELQRIYQGLAQLGGIHLRLLQEKLASFTDFTAR